jgi:hypothetical protein
MCKLYVLQIEDIIEPPITESQKKSPLIPLSQGGNKGGGTLFLGWDTNVKLSYL